MTTALSDFVGGAKAGAPTPSQQAEQAGQGAKSMLAAAPQSVGVHCCGYKTRYDAGKAAVCNSMPKSKANNREYGGMIYQNPDGTYGYTNPVEGTFRDVNPDLSPAPAGTTTVGNYHTHSDYSVWSPTAARDYNNIQSGDIIQTGDPNRDDFNSDFYSSGDYTKYGMDTTKYGDFTGYLGTPSGDVKSFNQKQQYRDPKSRCSGPS